jgi:hypothetical protein
MDDKDDYRVDPGPLPGWMALAAIVYGVALTVWIVLAVLP